MALVIRWCYSDVLVEVRVWALHRFVALVWCCFVPSAQRALVCVSCAVWSLAVKGQFILAGIRQPCPEGTSAFMHS